MIYQYKPEVWNEARCKKLAAHRAKDGLGTPYPFLGYLGSSACCPATFGTTKYNGGTVINGEWYEGTCKPFPIIPKTYKIVLVPSWGWRIVKA